MTSSQPSGSTEGERPRIGVVVLHWNAPDDTAACLDSLAGSGYRAQTVFVVDNGSRIPLDDELTLAADVHLIRSERNLGFAGGCNLGIRAALHKNCEFVWLLNNDATVDPDALENLVREAEIRPRAGIIGSLILDGKNRDIVNHLGGQVHALQGVCTHVGRGQSHGSGSTGNLQRLDFVTGCSLLARKEMIQAVGLLDEGYFLYWEDADWCFRARAAGWDIIVAEDSLVYHEGSSALGSGSPLKSYYLARNSLRFTARFRPWLFPLAFFWWPRHHFLNHLLKGRRRHAALAWQGMLDWLRGRTLVPGPDGEPGGVQRTTAAGPDKNQTSETPGSKA